LLRKRGEISNEELLWRASGKGAQRERGLVKSGSISGAQLCCRRCTEMGTTENLWISSKLAR